MTSLKYYEVRRGLRLTRTLDESQLPSDDSSTGSSEKKLQKNSAQSEVR